MKLAKVKSKVLDEALKTNEFPSLHMYIAGLGGFERTSDGCFVSKVVKNSDNKAVLDIRLALEDYFFNEDVECNILLQLAEAMGHLDENEKPIISNKIIKTIEL